MAQEEKRKKPMSKSQRKHKYVSTYRRHQIDGAIENNQRGAILVCHRRNLMETDA